MDLPPPLSVFEDSWIEGAIEGANRFALPPTKNENENKNENVNEEEK